MWKSKNLNILSLFDGMSCGQLALNKIGIKYNNYYASEIDKHAIKVTQSNFPNTVQLGDVTKIDFKLLPKIDLLLAGSPCQGFSFAGKQLNFDDPRSSLFFEFVRAINECKPTYFLLENVRMKKEYQDIISGYLGVEPIEINSALVSAQNRKRLYWTNIPNIDQPLDRHIVLKDIIEHQVDDKYTLTSRLIEGFASKIERRKGKGFDKFNGQSLDEKSSTLTSRYYKMSASDPYINLDEIDAINYSSSGRGNGVVEGRFSHAEKAMTLTATGYTNRSMTCVKDKSRWRRFTPVECERLQTVPDGYTNYVSDTQRYKMLGNGWTVDVVAHILNGIK